MSFLKNHPFAVKAHFNCSTVLGFAVPKEQLKHLIPECLTLDCFQDKWAFIAIAMVETQDLRPKGMPRIFGSDFFLIGYRIFVRFRTTKGKTLRGLYILKSETNRNKMAFFGNIFTHYNYTTTDISIKQTASTKSIYSKKSDFQLTINTEDNRADLSVGTPFDNWKEARKFSGPLPFTFTYNKTDKTVLVIQGVRQNWRPKPISVDSYHFDFLDKLNLQGRVLANAFEIRDIPYYWEKGKLERWNP